VSMQMDFEDKCYGVSVVIDGFPMEQEAWGYRFSAQHRDSYRDKGEDDDFLVNLGKLGVPAKGKVSIAGFVTNGGSHPVVTAVRWKPVKMTVLEAQLVSTEDAKRAQEEREAQKSAGLTPEQQIARARAEGARALEQWDAAIRQNNAEIR